MNYYYRNFCGDSLGQVEAKINLAFFFISSCPKVNFLLARIKGNKSFIICQKEIYFWTRGNG